MGDFAKTIAEVYAVEGAAIDLGRGVHDGKLAPEAVVQVPLKMMNRHGLIAGATGTGKTVTLQTIAEQLSAAGVAVLVFHYADQKGLALLDLADLRALLTFLESDAGKSELEGIGGLSSSTVGVLLRALVGLETGGGNELFGEPQLGVADLMRSKGVGVFFVTQVPDDVPGEVLGQLGNRVQHALRAFTPDDAEALKAAASTYPTSTFYDVEELLTSMGIGEAAVTILSEDGVPTPVVHTRLRAPASRIGPADDVEGSAKASPLFAKYGTRAEAESAREKLEERLDRAEEAPAEPKGEPAPHGKRRRRARPPAPAPEGGLDQPGDFLNSREGKALQKKVARGLFGMLRKRL